MKFQIPMYHRQFVKVSSQNREYVESLCNDLENCFHFACQKWFNQLK